MLASQSRISESKRIEEIKEKGRIFQSKNFGVAILKRDNTLPPKFAFVISKKISKMAVNRNRINRSLNEGVRRNLRDIPSGYDFVFLAKKSISDRTTEEILDELRQFFLKFKSG